ncbi:MAG: hypothetical protein LBG65_03850 [Puniceicoccales bacterium]|nr:hypothetical protein [Puniceicoccales bacterium]
MIPPSVFILFSLSGIDGGRDHPREFVLEKFWRFMRCLKMNANAQHPEKSRFTLFSNFHPCVKSRVQMTHLARISLLWRIIYSNPEKQNKTCVENGSVLGRILEKSAWRHPRQIPVRKSTPSVVDRRNTDSSQRGSFATWIPRNTGPSQRRRGPRTHPHIEKISGIKRPIIVDTPSPPKTLRAIPN